MLIQTPQIHIYRCIYMRTYIYIQTQIHTYSEGDNSGMYIQTIDTNFQKETIHLYRYFSHHMRTYIYLQIRTYSEGDNSFLGSLLTVATHQHIYVSIAWIYICIYMYMYVICTYDYICIQMYIYVMMYARVVAVAGWQRGEGS